MLDVRFFKNPRFTAASASISLIFFAMFGNAPIFTWLLHHYEFELAQPAEYYREVMPTLILRPSDPCRVKYRRRAV